MASNPDAQVISSFPLPPVHYIKHYSNDNVAKGLAPKPPPSNIDMYV